MRPKVQILLSPSKTMNVEACVVADLAGRCEPVGLCRAKDVARVLGSKSAGELSKLLGVSKALGEATYEKYAHWETASSMQAIALYSGMAYAKLDGRTLSEEEMKLSQKKLVIPSAVWGPVRGLDCIKPYRLEMATKTLEAPYDKLALFWKDIVTENILGGFATEDRVLVNVASDEYAAAVDFTRLKKEGVKVVKCDFYQAGRRAPTVHLKFGRGLVARYVIQNDVETLDGLKLFDLEGYTFAESLSNEDTLVFTRTKAPDPPSSKRKNKTTKNDAATTTKKKKKP